MSAVVDAVSAALGDDVTGVVPGFGPVTVDVGRASWERALSAAVEAGASYADFLTAYDDGEGFAVVAHLATPDGRDHLLVRTWVPREDARLATATAVLRGLAWHERETAEMFGIVFDGHATDHLLLQPSLGLHPLRKDVVLASRVVRAWPGDHDPGDAGGRARRRTPPLGVPDVWGAGS